MKIGKGLWFLLFIILILPLGCTTVVEDDVPVEMGPGIERPERTNDFNFEYPTMAWKESVEGLVIMKGVVGRDGKVREITVLRGLKYCDEVAVKAFSRTKFKPARRNGRPISVYYTVTLQFKIPYANKASAIPPGMVFIPGNAFMMGCTEGDKECKEREYPRHEATVSPFFMDKTEVTVRAYSECVERGHCKILKTKSDDEKCNWGYKDRDNHPINCVEWYEADAYCLWTGKRLPSEAQWEYGARGGNDDWIYPWGNEKPDCTRTVMDDGWVGCGKGGTWPVGSKGEYGFGLADLAGNVGELVKDCHHDNYQEAPNNGKEWVPKYPEICEMRMVRGGSWGDTPQSLRVSERGSMQANDYYGTPKQGPGYYSADIGFRCAKAVD